VTPALEAEPPPPPAAEEPAPVAATEPAAVPEPVETPPAVPPEAEAAIAVAEAPAAPEPAALEQAAPEAPRAAPTEEAPAAALGGVAEINARLIDFVKTEAEAAFTFWRALRAAKTPGEAVRLQTAEVERAVSAAVTCWGDLARSAARLALGRRT
jgi:hypothetical protein